MAYSAIGGFPSQQLPFSKKTKKWRAECVDFGDSYSLIHYHLTRKSVEDMQIKTKVTKAVIETLQSVGVLGDLPESSQMSLF